MDQLTAMKVFVRVAERGSFSQAADELALSRPAASAHVAALEKHLGARLLHRTTRKVALTAEGADFLERARRILTELREAEEALRETRSRPQGRLRVDVPVAFGENLLLPALPEFSRRYPLIELDVRLNDRIVDLVGESVDVAMRVGNVQQAGLATRRIAGINLVTCASPAYLAEHGEPRTPDDLREHRLLGTTQASGAPPEWSFPAPYTPKRLGLKFAMLFSSATGPVVSAAAGLGITHTADLLLAEHVARGALKLILEDYVVAGPPISLVYPSGGHQAAKVRVFSDFAADLLLQWHEKVRRRIEGGPPAHRHPPSDRLPDTGSGE
ncbi:MAG TPA: LysR family transcriptional regulator [Steroidobacteraceae bacterium]|nr:LysR family transcriptional regulator [Steroidobacteraceae bacterium]